jgi:hypothetical protein
MHKKACRIQSYTRGFLQRLHEKKYGAAVVLQKMVRSRLARVKFIVAVCAVLRVQTALRVFLAKKEMRSRRRFERLDRLTSIDSKGNENCVEELEEEDALAFLSPVSMDPFVTYRAFSESGVTLAREVMAAVEQAEMYAATIERDLMGIDAGHIDDSEEDEESAVVYDEGTGADEENADLPVASALLGLINASRLTW